MNDALQAALAAEHAAIFGYGVLGPHLTGPARGAAAEAEQAHRTRRDAVAMLLVAAESTPTPAEPGYGLPFKVIDRATALKLAVAIEERTAAAWRAVVPQVTDGARRTAVGALSDCAVRAAQWRRRLAPAAPATVPFPGV